MTKERRDGRGADQDVNKDVMELEEQAENHAARLPAGQHVCAMSLKARAGFGLFQPRRRCSELR